MLIEISSLEFRLLTAFVRNRGRVLRVRAKISSHSGASAGRADARRRDAGDVLHRRGAATPQMPARRRAPQGGRLANIRLTMRHFQQNPSLKTLPQNVKLIFARALSRDRVLSGCSCRILDRNYKPLPQDGQGGLESF